MSRQHPRTDIGTILLHWLVVAALLCALVTGLRIGIDAQGRAWLRWLGAVLPQGKIWSVHIGAGLALAALVAASIVYSRQARLTGRIKLDRARLSALRHRGRSRRGAVSVLLAWSLVAVLLVQIGTGTALYLGYGGGLVTVHFWAAMALVGLPIAHVVAHWAYGGLGQLLRIVRPIPLETVAAVPSLAELVAEEFDRSQPARSETTAPDRTTAAAGNVVTLDPMAHVQRLEPPRATGTRLTVHPLTSAAAAGLLLMTVAVTVDRVDEPTLVIRKIERNAAPVLNGDLDDPVWRNTRAISVATNQGANLGGTGTSRVDVRAVHDGKVAYFAFTWDDPTRSLKHLPLIKRETGWHLLHGAYDIEDENAYYEDKFAVMLARTNQLAGAGSAHLGHAPLAGKPAAFSGRGLHYTSDGGIVDVWHWKAARGGLLGYVDDNYFGPPTDAKPAEVSGHVRYKAGYSTDPGTAFYKNNFASEPPGGYRGPIQPARLPKDLDAVRLAMGRTDITPEHGEEADARWWMMDDESVPYSAGLDAGIPVGTVIPGILIAGTYSGDRADVHGAAKWAAGRWTLELVRHLDTKSDKDIAIATGIFMWVAVFDHTQTRHTRHLRPIRLEVQ